MCDRKGHFIGEIDLKLLKARNGDLRKKRFQVNAITLEPKPAEVKKSSGLYSALQQTATVTGVDQGKVVVQQTAANVKRTAANVDQVKRLSYHLISAH